MPLRLRDDLLALVLLVVLAIGAHLAHHRAADAFGPSSAPPGEVSTFYLPSGEVVRKLCFGQQTTVADLYFLKMVQYIGTESADRAGWPQLLDLGELITDVDPDYYYAYEVAGILLSDKRRIDESNQIFEKGIAAVPDRWQLPFFAAYNYWFELQDLKTGEMLLWKASKLPGAPEYTSVLAARLASNAHELDSALAYVDTMLGQQPNPKVRERLEARRVDILVEMDLQRLEAAIADFQVRTGRLPDSLSVLFGPLQHLPTAPDGSAYQYDPANGTVRSPLLPKRLHYERHK
jgi:tetratricopeptide (TPR) repeat protein